MANQIIVDALGGDNAPLCNLQGAADAVAELGVGVTLVGPEQQLRALAEQQGVSLAGITFVQADRGMDMHLPPTDILKAQRDCSMGVALDLLAAGKGDGLVSAGSTGALVVGATLIVGRIKGVKRPAIATLVPTPGDPYLLVDSGANAECRPEMLMDFAVMGDRYMRLVRGVASPRIGLLNVGTEDTKGDALRQETYRLLQASGLNFIGNVEGRDVPGGACDVLVTDGFAGNVVLKLTEGAGAAFVGMLKTAFYQNLKTKLGALLVKNSLRPLKGMMDYSAEGGAPLLGVKAPVVKAHGSSNAVAVKNAIRQADRFAGAGLIDAINQAVAAGKGTGEA